MDIPDKSRKLVAHLSDLEHELSKINLNYPRSDTKQDRECPKTQADIVKNADANITNTPTQEIFESQVDPKPNNTTTPIDPIKDDMTKIDPIPNDSSTMIIDQPEPIPKVRKVSRFRVSVITEPDPSKLDIKPDDSSDSTKNKSKPKLSLNLRDCAASDSNISCEDLENDSNMHLSFSNTSSTLGNDTPMIDILHPNESSGNLVLCVDLLTSFI